MRISRQFKCAFLAGWAHKNGSLRQQALSPLNLAVKSKKYAVLRMEDRMAMWYNMPSCRGQYGRCCERAFGRKGSNRLSHTSGGPVRGSRGLVKRGRPGIAMFVLGRFCVVVGVCLPAARPWGAWRGSKRSFSRRFTEMCVGSRVSPGQSELGKGRDGAQAGKPSTVVKVEACPESAAARCWDAGCEGRMKRNTR